VQEKVRVQGFHSLDLRETGKGHAKSSVKAGALGKRKFIPVQIVGQGEFGEKASGGENNPLKKESTKEEFP